MSRYALMLRSFASPLPRPSARWLHAVVGLALVVACLSLPATQTMKEIAAQRLPLGEPGLQIIAEHAWQQPFEKLPAAAQATALQVWKVLERNGALHSIPAAELHNLSGEDIRDLSIAYRAARADRAHRYLADSAGRPLVRSEARSIIVALCILATALYCFVTVCVPLPLVAFLSGILAVVSGVIPYQSLPSMYWSDTVWFIMGSLMFAVGFESSGMDKRLGLAILSSIRKPTVWRTSFTLTTVIALTAGFISDHVLAAIFLPIGLALYRHASTLCSRPQLGALLMLSVAMGCNIGGFGAPSGGSRNVIMLNYLQELHGIDISYIQWMIFGMPFVVVMVPLVSLVLWFSYQPELDDLSGPIERLRADVVTMGVWTWQQKVVVAIFSGMVFFWFAEQPLYEAGVLPVRLGIGLVAMCGGIAVLVAGLISWDEMQKRLDWGVVWIYAGAIFIGRLVDASGAAEYLAQMMTRIAGMWELESSGGILFLTTIMTAVMTQFMADGATAATLGTITLQMAELHGPGTTLVPFVGIATAAASSFAYCLVIGTPPNAILYASGLLKPRDFLRVGLPLWLLANVVLLLQVWLFWRFLGVGNLPGF